METGNGIGTETENERKILESPGQNLDSFYDFLPYHLGEDLQ